MPTKPTTPGSELSTSKALETKYSEALELVNQKHYDKAIGALESLVAEAETLGLVGMARSARNYLTVLRAKGATSAVVQASPLLEAQVLINRGTPSEALGVIGKALGTKGDDARLLYLKAIAHAQLEETEPAAEAMAQALALNSDLIHQYRLEKDFDRLRSNAAFASHGWD